MTDSWSSAAQNSSGPNQPTQTPRWRTFGGTHATNNITEIMTESQKRKAALDAMEEAKWHADRNAVVIANDAALLLKHAGHTPSIYPELAEYIRLRNIADALIKEVLP